MNHFQYRNGTLHAEDVAIEAIAARVGTPFYCYSTATLGRHYHVLAGALDGLDAGICYALKANANLAVVKTLARLGAGADVVSEGELRIALKAGIPPERIVFAGVGKTRDEMRAALMAGIHQFNVESDAELAALSEVAQGLGRIAPIAVRVNPDIDPETHGKISTGHAETKFGVPIGRIRDFYARAAALPGIRIVGVHVHIGSQVTRLAPFEAAFRRIADLVRELRAAGHDVRRVDVGGGLGIPYDDVEPPPPDAYAEIIRATLGNLGCRILLEPGRLLVGNAGILVTRVIYLKQQEARTFVIADAAMNDLIRPTLYEAYHRVLPVVEPAQDAPLAPVDVVGPVCETGDVLAADRPLPPVAAGDLLAIMTAGAYGAVMASTYNARPLPAEVLVDGGRYAVVRRRPSYDEMLALEQVPDWLADEPAERLRSMA